MNPAPTQPLRGVRRATATIASACVSCVASAQTPTFDALTAPFGDGSEIATIGGLSADGSVVVGGVVSRNGAKYAYSSFRWRRSVGFDRPVPAREDELSLAVGVSADGCVIVGNSDSSSEHGAWVASESGVVALPGRSLSGISRDGLAAPGWTRGIDGDDRPGVYRIGAARWRELALPHGFSAGRAVAAGGSVVAGEVGTREAPAARAVVWTEAGAAAVPSRGGPVAASLVRVSESGGLLLGTSLELVDDPLEGAVHDRIAWTWTAAQGLTEISRDFEARAVSSDGRLAGGSRVDEEYGTPRVGVVWDALRGTREARSLLEEAGLAPEVMGWTLVTVDAIGQSGDTYAMAGTGFDDNGGRAGWVATFTLPRGPRRLHAAGPSSVSSEPARGAHVDQSLLNALVRSGNVSGARELAFNIGDVLFNTALNESDGVGANVGNGQRFTRVPRADLNSPGQWATHTPARITGPSAASCNACHAVPFDDGGGGAQTNITLDPLRSGRIESMLQRNPPHLFGAGAVQLLAEEMTAELRAIADGASAEARRTGRAVTRALSAKGVGFGSITVSPPAGGDGDVSIDTGRVEGVAHDLIVRPFSWKGGEYSLRRFTRDAAHREVGLQAIELVGDGVDGDYDGTVDELSVGDVTALTVYIAGQPRPTSLPELADVGLINPLSGPELGAIERGKIAFGAAGCAACHVPTLTLVDPVFREPSASPRYRDSVLPSGRVPADVGLLPEVAVCFDLTRDQTDNLVSDLAGTPRQRLGEFRRDGQGGAVVELYGDLKRHDMGPDLVDGVDEIGSGRSVFLTKNLWGVGSTAPYLHDGRATTLLEAIAAHGGEARESRDSFDALPDDRRADVLEFLKSLVLHKID